MAPFDRIRRMTGRENRIEQDLTQREELQASGGSPESKTEKQEAAKPPVPQSMSALYVETNKVDNAQHFYRDYQRKDLIARASDSWIATTKQDARTIRDVVDYAQQQGWTNVTLKGSPEFKREAWIEARSRGMEATGYKPTEPDIQEAQRRAHKEGRNPAQNEIHNAAQPPQEVKVAPGSPEKGQAPELGKATAPAASKQARGATNPGPADGATSEEKLALRDGMSAPEHRAVTREARKHLSDDGKLVLSAINTKIDKEMDKLSTESKAHLKAVAAVEMVQKERSQGPISLTQEQRSQGKAAPTPEQESAALKAEKARLHSHISNAKTPVSDKVIKRFDDVSNAVEKRERAQGKEQKQAQQTAKPKPQQPERKEQKREPEAPRRSRPISR